METLQTLEDYLYSAEEHGRRYKMFDEIEKIKLSQPQLRLEEIYDKAYKTVMNTRIKLYLFVYD